MGLHLFSIMHVWELIFGMEWVLLTVVSGALIGQAMLSCTSCMGFVGVAMDAFATMSATVTSMAVRTWVMPRVTINIVLHDTVLVHGQVFTCKTLLLIAVLIVIFTFIIIFIVLSTF